MAESYHGEAERYHEETERYHGESGNYHGAAESYHEEDESYMRETGGYHGEAESYMRETGSYHGAAESYHGKTESVPSGPRADRQTLHNDVEAASSSEHAIPPHASQSLQRQREETPGIGVVTAGTPVFTPVAGKGAETSISSMEDAFGRKFGASRRSRCCGICNVM